MIARIIAIFTETFPRLRNQHDASLNQPLKHPRLRFRDTRVGGGLLRTLAFHEEKVQRTLLTSLTMAFYV
jgi:hypothetical protein